LKVTIMVISVCFSWALDLNFISFRFCLAAVHELYQIDEQIEKMI